MGSAAFAADMRGPMPVPMAGPPVEEFFSSWYVRLDGGFRANNLSTGQALGIPFATTDYKNSGTIGGGIGYKWNWFRGDVTFDYGNAPKFSGTTFANAALNAPYTVTAKIGTYTTLANAYIDMGTWWGFTPYIGGGIGATYLKPSGFALTDTTFTTYRSLTPDAKWAFSWAGTAGVSYAFSPTFLLDASYRYLSLGEARSMVNVQPPPVSDVTYGNLTAQEFRLGLRYLIP
jgi:opacity protein-like surface antigen